jgi:hypothetical protein
MLHSYNKRQACLSLVYNICKRKQKHDENCSLLNERRQLNKSNEIHAWNVFVTLNTVHDLAYRQEWNTKYSFNLSKMNTIDHLWTIILMTNIVWSTSIVQLTMYSFVCHTRINRWIDIDLMSNINQCRSYFPPMRMYRLTAHIQLEVDSFPLVKKSEQLDRWLCFNLGII